MYQAQLLVLAAFFVGSTLGCTGNAGSPSVDENTKNAALNVSGDAALPAEPDPATSQVDALSTEAVDSIAMRDQLVTISAASAKTPTTPSSKSAPSTTKSAPAVAATAPMKANPVANAPGAPALSSNAPSPNAAPTGAATLVDAATSPDHEAFSKLLKKYVSATGAVDYAGLKADRAKLDAYIATLAAQTPSKSWTKDEQLAYWINAYNAGTIRLIVDNYPLSSIQKLDGGKPWDVKRLKLGGQNYSLNQIENEIIRPQFKEPRIHFAVNCAAKGCPPLRNEAYMPDKLEKQLAEQAKKFINNSAYNTVEGKTLKVSRIFDWYGKDFGDVATFIAKFRDVPKGSTVTFGDYDWALNKQ